MAADRPVVARGPSQSPVEDEEARGLLQQRLVLIGRTFTAILLGFDLVALLAELPLVRDPWPRLVDPGNLTLFGSTFVWLGLWLYVRRGRLSYSQLRRIDALFVVTFGGLASLLAFGSPPPGAPGDPPTWAVLALTNTLILRAVVIPSSARRTLVLSVVSSLPTTLTSYLAYRWETGSTPLALMLTSWALAFCVSATAVATLTSRVIYGLRREVREARRLGQYRLEEKIGEGGMGVVYRASHAMLRRPTAIKLLPAERAGADRLGRFEREVQLTSQLTHANTVAIFDYGRTVDGVFYYAMEYLDGLDLEQLVRRDGPQPAGRVIHVLRQVAGSLAEAHGVGLIHRDIKPANVILVPQRGGAADVAKVVDFGLVKELEPGRGDLTQENTIAGTPLYLAPETIRSSEPVDARADLYALGALGFFLLTGSPVFSGGNAAEILGHHLHTPPPRPAERLGRPTSEKLTQLLLSCLEKSPERRPPSAEAVLEALEACDDAPAWRPADARAWWEGRGRGYRRGAQPADAGAGTAVTVSHSSAADASRSSGRSAGARRPPGSSPSSAAGWRRP